MTYQRTMIFDLSDIQQAEMYQLLNAAMSERDHDFKTVRQSRNLAKDVSDEQRTAILEKISIRALELTNPLARTHFDAYNADQTTVAAFAIADILGIARDSLCSPLQVLQAATQFFNMRLGSNSEFGPLAELMDAVLDVASVVARGETPPEPVEQPQTSAKGPEPTKPLTNSERQMAAVREAFWTYVKPNDGTWHEMCEALGDCGIDDPSPAQLKAVFMLLDDREFCAMLEWDVDTVVRENLDDWVEEHKEKILAAVKDL